MTSDLENPTEKTNYAFITFDILNNTTKLDFDNGGAHKKFICSYSNLIYKIQF